MRGGERQARSRGGKGKLPPFSTGEGEPGSHRNKGGRWTASLFIEEKRGEITEDSDPLPERGKGLD